MKEIQHHIWKKTLKTQELLSCSAKKSKPTTPDSAIKQETHMKIQDHKAVPAQKVQSKPRGPMTQKVPPWQEENIMVKCRECGAFGHTARSRRCPIKYGQKLLDPQPLGARKEKENQDPRRTQGLQKPGPISQAKTEKKPSQVTGQRGDEQQRKAPFQKLPMDPQRRGQHINLVHPKMPVFSPGNTKKSVTNQIQITVSRARKSPGKRMCPGNPGAIQSSDASCILPSRQEEGQNMAVPGVSQPVFRQGGGNTASQDLLHQKLRGVSHQQPIVVPKRNGVSEAFHTESEAQGPGVKTQRSQHAALHQGRQNPELSFWTPGEKASWQPTLPSQKSSKRLRVNSTSAPEESNASTVLKACRDRQSLPIANRLGLKDAVPVSKKIAAQLPSTDQEQLPSRPALVSATPYAESSQPSTSHAVRQSLRMVFTRLNGDWWSSRFLTVSPALAHEKQTAPWEGPAFLEKGEAARSQVPVSVLYEDLQVSSSSEDSDGQ
ncbi:LOW QUALITY PROTEIN: putative protein FAM90A13P [Meriones unguiculatus]|uniref:LOW QUALITY PROTEIN: putative protein FAM90A13P n=1 Tax=Meriones unguiculatus TaxID=10047 RepID=UPI00293E075A|nr:LOW QUALITY PROTEIN: putative protein FAM90A13P [Meriones unguiculatus]